MTNITTPLNQIRNLSLKDKAIMIFAIAKNHIATHKIMPRCEMQRYERFEHATKELERGNYRICIYHCSDIIEPSVLCEQTQEIVIEILKDPKKNSQSDLDKIKHNINMILK